MNVWEIVQQSYAGYFRYLINEITHPHSRNYFWFLVSISFIVYSLELIAPWRRQQPRIRQDFWQDAFYMFFNFFLFPLIGFIALSNLATALWQGGLAALGFRPTGPLSLHTWPALAQLAFYFLLKDFIQWNIHRLLHRVPWLWRFHQVHHSALQMGFSAHLRFHFAETIIYKSLQFVPLWLFGVSVTDFFILDAFSILIGHLNHSNLKITWGPLGYILNSPAMHIWHHAKELPPGMMKKYAGVNFGLTLSLWDYLFGTAYLPADGRDLRLGFPGDERFPKTFIGQLWPPAAGPQSPPADR
jgi:sterol desaturase/sphingolipid hydroxylase (fatty acid hydroxylase superfamily)